MAKLHLGIEIRDFDLERMGFSLSVLDQAGGGRSTSEAYLRMTLIELNAFLNALRSVQGEIDLSTTEPTAGKKMPPSSAPRMPPEAPAPITDTVAPTRRR